MSTVKEKTKNNFPYSKKLCFPLVIFIIGIDQLVKFFLRSAENGVLINSGISFGLLQNIPGNMLIFFLFLICLALLLLMIKEKNRYRVLALGLVLSGGVGNLIDRVFFGGVIDYFQIWISPVFNISDVMILAGLAWVTYSLYADTAKKNI